MASRNGYKLLKTTNDDDTDLSPSKSGLSPEAQAGGQNIRQGLIGSGPVILEPSKVESLRFDERSKKKWTRSSLQILTREVPMSTSGSSSDSGSNLKCSGEEDDQPQNGGEEGDQPQNDDEEGDQPQNDDEEGGQPQNGGEGGDQPQDGGEEGGQPQNGGEEGDQPQDGGEEGSQPQNGGEEGDQPQNGGEQSHTNCWTKFKNCYLSIASWAKKYLTFCYQILTMGLAITTIYWGFINIKNCHDFNDEKNISSFPGFTIALAACAIVIIFLWWWKDCGRHCWNCEKMFMIIPIVVFMIFYFIQLFIFFVSKCKEPYDSYPTILQYAIGAFLCYAIVVYSPSVRKFLSAAEQQAVDQNGECHIPALGPEEQV